MIHPEETVASAAPTEVPLPPYPLATIPVNVDVELRYEIRAGRVLVTIDGLSRTYRDGEIFIVPPGVAHTFAAADDGGARLVRHDAMPPPRDTET